MIFGFFKSHISREFSKIRLARSYVTDIGRENDPNFMSNVFFTGERFHFFGAEKVVLNVIILLILRIASQTKKQHAALK